MSDAAYVARIRVERAMGKTKRAFLPAEDTPVLMGVHGEIAAHYKVSPEKEPPRASTIDYLIAAAGGCLVGTFSGALEARGIPAGDGRLHADVVGEVEAEGGVLVVKRIRVLYHLRAEAAQREVIERVLSMHAPGCPVYRSIQDCIDISTDLELITD